MVDDVITVVYLHVVVRCRQTELFPNTRPKLLELCAQGIGEAPEHSIPDLIEVVGKDDEILSKALGWQSKQYDLKFKDVVVDENGARSGSEYEHGSTAASTPQTVSVTGLRVTGNEALIGGHVFRGPGSGNGVAPRDELFKMRQREVVEEPDATTRSEME